jgi:hypothetical protein
MFRQYFPTSEIFKRLPIVVASSLCVGTAAHANLFSASGADPREPCPRLEKPYSAIGMVESISRVPWRDPALGPVESFIHGTGFMISPCFAMTNFHVVFGDGEATPDRSKPHYAWISLGGDKSTFAMKVPAAVVAWGDFSRKADADWAILEVTGCPGGNRAIGWLAVAPADPRLSPRLWEAGFDWQDGEPSFERQERCVFGAARNALTVETYCPARPGWSGAPIGLRRAGALPVVVAMTSREQRPSTDPLTRREADRANLAVRVDEALTESGLEPLIAKDIEAASAPLP